MDIPAGRFRRLLYKMFPSLDPHKGLTHYWRLTGEPNEEGLQIAWIAFYRTGGDGWFDIRVAAKKNGEPLKAVLTAVAREITLKEPEDKK